ncbi:MAG TPA: nicotinate-nucleotide adenylyltransferase [Verrucomicrobiales bacterium]|nr:nicotinate-nucleotide adenylyltransferase [Verrucomicrobiales bacterium]
MNDRLDTHQKALQINLDAGKYGVFAEIGAGQEVARWFFRVGGASGTIAKSMSAYDMVVSDAIYGTASRYVSKQRLEAMLDHEYSLLVERLAASRGENTRFFTFADTVAARGFKKREETHGWMGIRFQTEPGAGPSDIIMHVRMWDRENLQQQEALGILGVNLIHAALYLHWHADGIVNALLDNLSIDRIEVDMIQFRGEQFSKVDNRLLALQLVERGLTNAAMFMPSGELVQPADALHKKCILIERGSFRPVTRVTADMLQHAQAQFIQDPKVAGNDLLVVLEMTLKNLNVEGKIDHRDFLDRVDLLGTLGHPVLISNYGEFFRLAGYLFRYTKLPIGIVMGVPTLKDLFEQKYYTELEGGILESFGRMFRNDLKIYCYPLKDGRTETIITAGNLQVAPHLQHLYDYLRENKFIQSLRDVNKAHLGIFSRDVLKEIQANTAGWEEKVPARVAAMIKERKLLGYRE